MLTTEDTAFIIDLGRRLEAFAGLPEASGPTCSHRGYRGHGWEGIQCELPAGHSCLHTGGGGYVWGSPDLPICLSEELHGRPIGRPPYEGPTADPGSEMD